jgi:hypothetical protein
MSASAEARDAPALDASEQFDETRVYDASAMLDRIGADTDPLQALRELTVNAIQGIAKLAENGERPAEGTILWGTDQARVLATNGRERKLSIADTGVGMTPREMRRYIKDLAATGQEWGHTANHGVGGKISAGYRNPAGVVYRSWRGGVGAQVHFQRTERLVTETDPETGAEHKRRRVRYGLNAQRPGAGDDEFFWLPLSENDKPPLLSSSSSGTVVTLLGTDSRHDTTEAPEDSEIKRTWIRKYLNQRFFRLPDGITLLVREGDQITPGKIAYAEPGRELADGEEPETVELPGSWTWGKAEQVYGQEHYLEQRKVASGEVGLPAKTDRHGKVLHPGARVLWWLLEDDQRTRVRDGATWASSGHTAALFQDELYDFLPPTRGGYKRLADFGIRFGVDRVVLYLIPHDERLAPNTSRAHLLIDGKDLPWDYWSEQFAKLLSGGDERLADLRALQEREAADLANYARRLKEITKGLAEFEMEVPTHRADPKPREAPIAPLPGSDEPVQAGTRDDSPSLGEELEAALPAGPVVPLRPGATFDLTDTYEDEPGDDAAALVEALTAPAEPPPADAPAGESGDEPSSDSAPRRNGPKPAPAPDIIWVALRDGSRAPGDLEDLAGRFDARANVLTLNADFRFFKAQVRFWLDRYDDVIGAQPQIDAQVRKWIETTAIEVTRSRPLLLASRRWDEDTLNALLADGFVWTLILLAKLAQSQHIKKALAQQLGRR